MVGLPRWASRYSPRIVAVGAAQAVSYRTSSITDAPKASGLDGSIEIGYYIETIELGV